MNYDTMTPKDQKRLRFAAVYRLEGGPAGQPVVWAILVYLAIRYTPFGIALFNLIHRHVWEMVGLRVYKIGTDEERKEKVYQCKGCHKKKTE